MMTDKEFAINTFVEALVGCYGDKDNGNYLYVENRATQASSLGITCQEVVEAIDNLFNTDNYDTDIAYLDIYEYQYHNKTEEEELRDFGNIMTLNHKFFSDGDICTTYRTKYAIRGLLNNERDCVFYCPETNGIYVRMDRKNHKGYFQSTIKRIY